MGPTGPAGTTLWSGLTGTPLITNAVLDGLVTGTGVATANTPSTLVQRDGSGNFAAGAISAGSVSATGNVVANALNPSFRTRVSGGIVSLTVSDAQIQHFTGSTAMYVRLPGSCPSGTHYWLINKSTAVIYLNNFDGTQYVDTLQPNCMALVIANVNNPTAAAGWNSYFSSVNIPGSNSQFTFSSGYLTLAVAAAGNAVLTLPATTDTLVGRATTDTLTGKTISGSSNTLSNIPISALSTTGTPTGLNFLRGDGSWATVATGTGSYTASVGNGVATSFVITHNLNSRNVAIQVWDSSTYEDVEVDVVRTTVNTITLTFASAPSTNAYQVMVMGGQPVIASGYGRQIVSVTSSATLGATANTDYVALIGAGGAPTLPTAVGNTNRYTVKNVDTVNRTLATTGGQTIDGSATAVLTPNTSIDVISDGANWRVI